MASFEFTDGTLPGVRDFFMPAAELATAGAQLIIRIASSIFYLFAPGQTVRVDSDGRIGNVVLNIDRAIDAGDEPVKMSSSTGGQIGDWSGRTRALDARIIAQGRQVRQQLKNARKIGGDRQLAREFFPRRRNIGSLKMIAASAVPVAPRLIDGSRLRRVAESHSCRIWRTSLKVEQSLAAPGSISSQPAIFISSRDLKKKQEQELLQKKRARELLAPYPAAA